LREAAVENAISTNERPRWGNWRKKFLIFDVMDFDHDMTRKERKKKRSFRVLSLETYGSINFQVLFGAVYNFATFGTIK
jgi:hypothetical protein